MKLTSQEEYGLRCLLQLAQAPEGFGTIHTIAEREGLTPAYVAKLLGVLKRAQLVHATRGHNGGYQLARPAEAIDLSEVLTALGGRIYSPAFCQAHAGGEAECRHNNNCSIRPVLVGLDRLVHEALSMISLKSLVRSEPAMQGWLKLRIHGPEQDAFLAPIPVKGKA
ncbi:MAG: RrF2 family transcriptional regulator [Candidatus Eiseniibacteriota bacterium]